MREPGYPEELQNKRWGFFYSGQLCLILEYFDKISYFDQGRTGELKMSGGPADLPALLEEVRDMADRGGMMLIMMMVLLV